jgi:hypothetical protein
MEQYEVKIFPTAQNDKYLTNEKREHISIHKGAVFQTAPLLYVNLYCHEY